jgi:hypothetical protein
MRSTASVAALLPANSVDAWTIAWTVDRTAVFDASSPLP